MTWVSKLNWFIVGSESRVDQAECFQSLIGQFTRRAETNKM